MATFKKTKKTFHGFTAQQMIDRSGNNLFMSTFSTVQMPKGKIVMIKMVADELIVSDENIQNVLSRLSL